MNRYTKAIYNELQNLTQDSQALITATADAAEHEVVEARKRLSAALERSKQAWAEMQGQAREGMQAADEAIREHRYQAVGIAFGAGLVLGCLWARRKLSG
jgi:ElaB/YqjD/DUF883 family membrane-anchored ribosome-binding protein